jgi:hypothetical protein
VTSSPVGVSVERVGAKNVNMEKNGLSPDSNRRSCAHDAYEAHAIVLTRSREVRTRWCESVLSRAQEVERKIDWFPILPMIPVPAFCSRRSMRGFQDGAFHHWGLGSRGDPDECSPHAGNCWSMLRRPCGPRL